MGHGSDDFPIDYSRVRTILEKYSPDLREQAVAAIQAIHARVDRELIYTAPHVSLYEEECVGIFTISYYAFADRFEVDNIKTEDAPHAERRGAFVVWGEGVSRAFRIRDPGFGPSAIIHDEEIDDELCIEIEEDHNGRDDQHIIIQYSMTSWSYIIGRAAYILMGDAERGLNVSVATGVTVNNGAFTVNGNGVNTETIAGGDTTFNVFDIDDIVIGGTQTGTYVFGGADTITGNSVGIVTYVSGAGTASGGLWSYTELRPWRTVVVSPSATTDISVTNLGRLRNIIHAMGGQLSAFAGEVKRGARDAFDEVIAFFSSLTPRGEIARDVQISGGDQPELTIYLYDNPDYLFDHANTIVGDRVVWIAGGAGEAITVNGGCVRGWLAGQLIIVGNGNNGTVWGGAGNTVTWTRDYLRLPGSLTTTGFDYNGTFSIGADTFNGVSNAVHVVTGDTTMISGLTAMSILVGGGDTLITPPDEFNAALERWTDGCWPHGTDRPHWSSDRYTYAPRGQTMTN